VSGTEYAVLNMKFNSTSSPAPQVQIKLADYLDGGADAQGNTFTVSGNTGFFYHDDLDSRNNFYPADGGIVSTVGGTVSAGFARTVALVTLPVNLLNFSGVKNGNKNVLRWTTANETNNLGFEVQRSSNGVNYTSLGFVNSLAAGGTISSSTSYTFDDNSPASAKQYYRLKHVDKDGHAKLSTIVMITSGKPTILSIGSIFPNPARSLVSVVIDAPARQDVTLLVSDLLGKTVKQQMVNVEIGSNTIPVEIANLAPGSYLVKVVCKSDCETTVGRFIKE
jgi:hypothetical protein